MRNRPGDPRRDAIERLVPKGRVVIDVGADHGRVAEALGAIATERMPHRRSNAPVQWVVADGLAPFREVDVAVIAGMGAKRIARIIERGPKPRVVVCHAQDDPEWLRTWLGTHGYFIADEAVAKEASRWAEIVRAELGPARSAGLDLALGPVLAQSPTPMVLDMWESKRRHWARIAEQTRRTAPDRHKFASDLVAWLDHRLARSRHRPL